MRGLTRIDGGCHCGNIRFVLWWPEAEAEIAVRECGCTFCRKHGGAWTSHRLSELAIEIDDAASVSKYSFGTKTADFHVCSICGSVPFVLSEIDSQQYAVVNTNCFENAGDFTLASSSTSFDGEDTESRLERRKRNWIPTVRFRVSGS